MKRQLVTAANGFIPVNLNTAQFASTYFPADFQHRLGLALGHSSRFITGVDLKGRFAQRTFLEGSFDEAASGNKVHKDRFQAYLDAYNVVPSELIHTDHTALPSFVAATIKCLQERGCIDLRDTQSIHCKCCDNYLSKSEVSSEGGDLKGADDIQQHMSSCRLCGSSNLEVINETQYFLKLDRDPEIKKFLGKRSGKTVKKMIEGVWDSDFTAWEFSRNQSYYGSPFPGDDQRKLYLWYESLVSKFIGLSHSDNLEEALKDTAVKSFFGKNIIQYYSLVFPKIIKDGFGLAEIDLTLCSRGFCNLDKSSPDLLDIERASQLYDVDEIRFYCAYIVNDDVRDFSLTVDAMRFYVDGALNGVIMNYLTKASAQLNLTGFNLADQKVDPVKLEQLDELWEQGQPRKILLLIEEMAREGLKRVNKGQFNPEDENDRQNFLIVGKLMSAFTPEKIKGLIPNLEIVPLRGHKPQQSGVGTQQMLDNQIK